VPERTSVFPIIGIIGGGQLARILIQQGQKVGFSFQLLCKDENDPAAQVLDRRNVTFGDPNKIEDLMQFLPKATHITFESEFVMVHQIQTALLRLAEKKVKDPNYFFPSLTCMAIFQDRLTQKNLLETFRIPTAPFLHSEDPLEIQAFFQLYKKVVFKKRMGGYDGYGTFIIQSKTDLAAFLKKNDPDDFICESFIPFQEELACSFARNQNGKLISFPLVQTVQKDNKCDSVFGPVKHSQFALMSQKISKVLTQIDYVGLITFEFFNANQKLLVNEVAPRVHNSAHYSLDALSIDQFLAHLKSGLGLDYASPTQFMKYFAMTNLIHLPESKLVNQKFISGKLHWYGKTESRPGRKMGHINYLSINSDILKQALQERKKLYEK
jgi:5-(carboxyamino)imidazole ribonucleotide synthase